MRKCKPADRFAAAVRPSLAPSLISWPSMLELEIAVQELDTWHRAPCCSARRERRAVPRPGMKMKLDHPARSCAAAARSGRAIEIVIQVACDLLVRRASCARSRACLKLVRPSTSWRLPLHSPVILSSSCPSMRIGPSALWIASRSFEREQPHRAHGVDALDDAADLAADSAPPWSAAGSGPGDCSPRGPAASTRSGRRRACCRHCRPPPPRARRYRPRSCR